MDLDPLAQFNQQRWEALARARVQYSRPALDLTPASARGMIDREGFLGDTSLEGQRVLCLAAGGGQQSAAFALLGAARVLVLDLSPTQLERDREAARHYGTEAVLETRLGDMRDLSELEPAGFDLVWQAHSLNFVPEAERVFRGVARALRPGGHYRLEVTNPFVHGAWEDSWTGRGYAIALPYADGEVPYEDPGWTVDDGQGHTQRVPGPREFRHTLSSVVNGLLGQGLALRGLWEDARGDPQAPPGSWQHFKRVAAPWITLWSQRAG